MRGLLEHAFEGDFSDHDWEHGLGGMHAIAWEDGTPIGHASVVQRRLVNAGRALRTGYVEAVGVRADRRRRGVAGALMDELERLIAGGYELGALGATDAAVPFYESRGWRRWEGPTSALTPEGIRRTPGDDGAIYVLAGTADLDPSGDLTCDWRGGDVW